MNAWKIGVVALALVVSAQRAPFAQEQPAEFMQVITATVNLGMQAEFEDYVKKTVAAAAKIGSAQFPTVYQVVMGGSPGMYFVATPFQSWAGADAIEGTPAILAKAHGEVEGAKILKAGRSTITSLDIAVSRLLPNLSTNPKAVMPPKAYLSIIRTDVEFASQAAYTHYLSMLKAAQEKEPSPPTINRRVSVQGPAAVYITTQGFDRFAERDAWPSVTDLLRKNYGEAHAQVLNSQSAQAIRSRVTYVARFRPDLSRLPGLTSNN